MAEIKKFRAELIAEGGGCAIFVPFDAEKVFGQRGRIPVCGTINGIAYRSSIFRMGQPSHFMVVNQQMREACGVAAGAKVTVTMARDDALRDVEVPAQLVAIFKTDPDLEAAWNSLSFTHRKEHALAINQAKRDDTRARRIEKIVAALRARKLKSR